MAFQLSFVLLGLSLVLVPSVLTASTPTAKLTANFSQFSLNNPFPLKCTIDGVTVSNTYIYEVFFHFNTSNSTVNPGHQSVPIAFYVGTPHCQACKPHFSTTADAKLKDYVGLTVSAGTHQVYPEFEATIVAQDARAYGTYSCAIEIRKIENDKHHVEYRSNEMIFK